MRRLANDEKELWERVIATVKPLRRLAANLHEEPVEKPQPRSETSTKPRRKHGNTLASVRLPLHRGGLDGSWDRRLARGLVRPDVTIDLHGHSLAAAYDLLDTRLAAAAAAGARLILLITGKPPRDERFPVTRGAIRASIDNWLRSSRHAPTIAAVRGAHPRHGGAGALYLVLRRSRP